jgi:predicted glycogen debranching enzyme
MDSLVKGRSAAERFGACVEIQLLWYNSLKIFTTMAKELGLKEEHQEIESLSKKIAQHFVKNFWDEKNEYAVDHIFEGKPSSEIRPNVILGMALPYKLFDKKKATKILAKVQKELLSDLGLLTLSKHDPLFKGRYSGTQELRDQAYHNGTIWPYLLGFYYLTIQSYFPSDADKLEEIKTGLIKFWKGIKERKLSYLPELFSPDDLHPDGCLSQAWNYAVFLEVYQGLNKK